MDLPLGLIYAVIAAAFWGGVLVLGFRGLKAWRDERARDRASQIELDRRLARIEADISAMRRVVEQGGAAALAPGARSGERPVERTPERAGLSAEPPTEHRR